MIGGARDAVVSSGMVKEEKLSMEVEGGCARLQLLS